MCLQRSRNVNYPDTQAIRFSRPTLAYARNFKVKALYRLPRQAASHQRCTGTVPLAPFCTEGAMTKFTLAIAVAVATTTGCSNPIGLLWGGDQDEAKTWDSSVASVGSPVLVYDSAARMVNASIPLTIRNVGNENLEFEVCGTALERPTRTGKGWQSVWFTLCTLETRAPTVIKSGATFTTTVEVGAQLGKGISPNWTEPVRGDYRLRLSLARQGVGSDWLPTHTFSLR